MRSAHSWISWITGSVLVGAAPAVVGQLLRCHLRCAPEQTIGFHGRSWLFRIVLFTYTVPLSRSVQYTVAIINSLHKRIGVHDYLGTVR